MSELNPDQGALQNPFSFQPPPGGDVSLKSCDGVIFLAHSVLLSLSSKVFSNMFVTPTTPDTVELTEDAEAVSLMLSFVYSVMRPPIDTLPLLEKAMLIAQKYDIDVLVKTLEQTRGQQIALIRDDPLRVFRLAADQGLRETQTLAAEILGPHTTSPEGIVEIAKAFPVAAHVIGAVGAQGVRSRIIDELLTKEGSKAHLIWPSEEEHGRTRYLSCTECCGSRPVIRQANIRGSKYQTGWLDVWASSLRSELSVKLLEECGTFFETGCLLGLKRKGGCCVDCVDRAFEGDRFDKWATDTRQVLETELAPLEVLYRL